MADVNTLEVMEDTQPTQPAQDQIVVVEEAVPEANKVPGSDAVLEVVEEEQQAQDTDWANDKDHSKFVGYMEARIKNIPRHSGNTIPGCERAVSYLKDCQNELRTAIRSDLDGKIDELVVDKLHKELQEMIERLEKQIEKLRVNGAVKVANVQVQLVTAGECNRCGAGVPTWHDVENDRVVCLKCDAEVGSDDLTKVANTPKLTVFISAFERAIVGTLIDSAVSNGKNIEEVYDKLDKKYKFTDRERLAIVQTVADYGFPCILDRAKIDDKDNQNDGELMRNYSA